MSYCDHKSLSFASVKSAKLRYRQPTEQQRREALHVSCPPREKIKSSGETKAACDIQLPPVSTFPAPVVVPGDELFHDPDYPPQSVQEWIDEEERNEVTSKRRTIYVVAPPTVSEDVAFVKDWELPEMPEQKSRKHVGPYRAHQPCIEDVTEYLRAFYHGLPVKVLKTPILEFTRWDFGEASTKHRTKRQAPKAPAEIGLSTSRETIRIRCRPSQDGIFSGQLNLDDLLDTTISILAEDAYALIMLVHHDLYEGDDDDFCCGRAYGGSRVAVISTARYRPELDAAQEVDLEHLWPASHCSKYIGQFFTKKTAVGLVKGKSHRKNTTDNKADPALAVGAAVQAFNALPLPSTPSELTALWLGRVCKTASHELGHCLGIDHCTYYACIMQGTAHLAEDSRQPPYLCPVDLLKVLQATKTNEGERYKALLKVCEKWEDDGMFAAFGAWIRSRLASIGILPRS